MAERIVITPEEGKDPSVVPAGAKEDGKGGIILDTSAPNEAKADETLILGKFKTQEDLVKAYTELEKSKGAKEATPPVTPQAPPTAEAAAKAVEAAGLDMSALSREVADNGELSAESLTALAAKGITKEVAEQFIEGQKALGAKLVTEIQGVAGGAEQYGKVTAWAQANMTDAEVGAFNDALHSGNIELAKFAVSALTAKYSAAVGSEGSLVEGNTTPTISGVKGYDSQAQIVAAMRDPRYKNDPAYIADVEKRMAKTSILGA